MAALVIMIGDQGESMMKPLTYEKTRTLFVGMLLGAIFLLPTVKAHAVPFSTTFGPVATPSTSASQINIDVPTTIVGDMTISLALTGDFGNIQERAGLVLDGIVDLGPICNNNPLDDAFGGVGPNEDICGDGGFHTGTVVVSNADIAPLITDGILNLQLFRNGDNNLANLIPVEITLAGVTFPVITDSIASSVFGGTLSFETGVASDVPEPASLLLFGAGLIGLRFSSRRRGKAA